MSRISEAAIPLATVLALQGTWQMGSMTAMHARRPSAYGRPLVVSITCRASGQDRHSPLSGAGEERRKWWSATAASVTRSSTSTRCTGAFVEPPNVHTAPVSRVRDAIGVRAGFSSTRNGQFGEHRAQTAALRIWNSCGCMTSPPMASNRGYQPRGTGALRKLSVTIVNARRADVTSAAKDPHGEFAGVGPTSVTRAPAVSAQDAVQPPCEVTRMTIIAFGAQVLRSSIWGMRATRKAETAGRLIRQ